MDMKQTIISVVIPVYNVEEYLSRCVESVLAQTYTNLEIFLVDDGSTDNSGMLCDEYAAYDRRIKVIHKENGGLSDARNVALDKISGEYITFIDSDDWVSQYYIENLYAAIELTGANMSISCFENVWNDGECKNKNLRGSCIGLSELTPERCLEKMLYQDQIETCACGKLYSERLFKNLRYPKGKLYEDLAVTYKAIAASQKIAFILNVDYYYFQRADSIQYKAFDIRKMDAVSHVMELVKFIEREYPFINNAAYCRALSTTSNIIFQIHSDEFSEQKRIAWDIIKKYRSIVLLDRKARKKARLAAAISYFGYNWLYRAYSITQKRANI